MTMTDAQAEAARKKLAEYEATKAAEARQAENEKRAACRAVVQPIADAMPALQAATQELRDKVEAGMPGEWDLANLARNVLTTAEGLARRVERRLADTEPVPEPEPVVTEPAPE